MRQEIIKLFTALRDKDYYKQAEKEQDERDLEYMLNYLKNKGICSHCLEARDYKKVKVKKPSFLYIKNSLDEDLE